MYDTGAARRRPRQERQVTWDLPGYLLYLQNDGSNDDEQTRDMYPDDEPSFWRGYALRDGQPGSGALNKRRCLCLRHIPNAGRRGTASILCHGSAGAVHERGRTAGRSGG